MDPPPATVFTFFLALPYALPIPGELNPGFVDERTPIWDGWSPQQLADMVGIEEPFSPETVPGTRMAIRHREVTMPVPFVAAFEAFVDWIEPPLSEEVFARLRDDTEAHKETGMDIVLSVVALSRFMPRSEHPSSGSITVSWLLALFRRALNDLNSWLEALGLVTRRWDIGTLAPRALPAMVPILAESTHPDSSGGRQGATTIIPLHDAFPAFSQAFDPKLESYTNATKLSNEANQGHQPYMLAFRLIHAAEGERLAGDPTRAMIDLNTAIEVLVSVTLSEGGRSVGWDEEKIDAAIGWRTGLKKRVSEYLSELLGETIDPRDETSVWGLWFTGGYLLRNAAVHEGQRLTKDHVDVALEQARAVLKELREGLSRNEKLTELGGKLAIEFGADPPWEGDSVEINFPWD